MIVSIWEEAFFSGTGYVRGERAQKLVAWYATQPHSQSAFVESLNTIISLRVDIPCAQRIHEIIGNPFRPVTLDPRWQSSTVLDLARTIYDQRTFENMPILADALMDAGCDSDEIIQHCQGPGPHVRGCWVVDLLTGRE